MRGVGLRYDTEHSMLRRKPWNDYQARCVYQLTLTLADRSQPRLGALEAEGDEVRCEPSALGQKVLNEWHAIEREYPQLLILKVQLMPEHLHVVLFVRETLPLHLSKIVAKVKNRTNHPYWAELTAAGLLGPKGTSSPPPLWSKNYQDTLLTHSGQLEAMLNYVADNPRRAWVKRQHPDLFTVTRELKIGDKTFAAIGNHWLLSRPERLQVRCHNNEAPGNVWLIEQQKGYFLSRGQHGAVVVSPCISEGEKKIATAALQAKVPLIVLLENGFKPLYKPSGKYFDACADGLLLILAPWPYHMEKRKITRAQCDALNAMAAAVSSEPWTREMEEEMMRGWDGKAGVRDERRGERPAHEGTCGT